MYYCNALSILLSLKIFYTFFLIWNLGLEGITSFLTSLHGVIAFMNAILWKHNLILVKHCFNLFGRTTTLLVMFAIVWKLNRSDKSASLFFFEEVHSALLRNSCKIEGIWISYRGAKGNILYRLCKNISCNIFAYISIDSWMNQRLE